MPPAIRQFPDIEQLIVRWLTPRLGSDYLICQSLPDSGLPLVTVRISRISGAARDIKTDRPLVDTDVFTTSYDATIQAASEIQALYAANFRNLVTIDGIVQSVSVINGPRFIPDINDEYVRYGATNEFHTHALTEG